MTFLLVTLFHLFGWTKARAVVSALAIGAARELTQMKPDGWSDMLANFLGAAVAILVP